MTAMQYSIIAACLSLAIFLVWKEVKRTNKSRLWLRIIASVFSILSLIFLAIPIEYNANETYNNNEAALLTDGYNKDSVDAFLKQNKNAVVYTKDEYEQHDAIYKLHVFGYGLSADEWKTLNTSGIVFHPATIGNGITNIGYDKRINSGDVFTVQGKFNNTSNKATTLTLSGFGNGFDSVVIQSNTSQTFILNTIPKFIGRAVYELTATINKDTIEHEYLPFDVASTRPLKILLLAAYPDFENKFLQNWLSENKYVVASRTTISKNKYSYAYVDTTAFSLEQITPTILSKFDVLIADGAALSSLSKQELFNIKNQINDNGLGLIIKADSTEKPALFYNNNCSIAASANHNKQTLSIKFPGNDTISLLPVENVSFIHLQDDAQPFITDAKQNVLVCNALYGQGSIVFSAFANSYYWMLSGDKKSYASLWSSLIEKAARKETVNKQWQVQPAFPTVNEPAQLTAETVSEQPLQSTVENNFIAFAAQPFLPVEWQATYWPVKSGWQYILSSDGEKFWFYVFDKNAWKNITALQKIQGTYAYISANTKTLGNETAIKRLNKKMMPAFYFFVVFMCCCIFLWIEKKLS